MKKSIHQIKVPGLYVVSINIGTYRYCELRRNKDHALIRSYANKPIIRITDFIKLFEDNLSGLDWTVDPLTKEHGARILEMEKNIHEDDLGKRYVKKK